MSKELAAAIRQVFQSPNVADSNLEPANVVDALDRHASAVFSLAKAINGLTAYLETHGSDLRTGGR